MPELRTVDACGSQLVTLNGKIVYSSSKTIEAIETICFKNLVKPNIIVEFRTADGYGDMIDPGIPKNQRQEISNAAQYSEADAERLVRDNIGWMLALAQRLLCDRGLAEDAVQEAFMAAFRGLEGFEGRSTIKTWLHRITVNASLTKLRQLKRLAEQPIDEYLPEFDRFDCRVEAPWKQLAPVHDVLESEDLRARVSKTIAELPDAYRIVLQLRDIEGYDTSEVANLLGISESNVKIRLHRARAALKKLLEPILRGEERG